MVPTVTVEASSFRMTFEIAFVVSKLRVYGSSQSTQLGWDE
jgi:hypothetical protein